MCQQTSFLQLVCASPVLTYSAAAVAEDGTLSIQLCKAEQVMELRGCLPWHLCSIPLDVACMESVCCWLAGKRAAPSYTMSAVGVLARSRCLQQAPL